MDYDIQGAKKQYAEILKSGNNDQSKRSEIEKYELDMYNYFCESLNIPKYIPLISFTITLFFVINFTITTICCIVKYYMYVKVYTQGKVITVVSISNDSLQ